MSQCKENVLEMIDQAFRANHLGGYCTCRYPTVHNVACNYCKIEEGLTVARACIVASVEWIDVMMNMGDAMQELIEKQLKGLMEE